MERKNPLGVLSAFKQAFDKENDKVGLVIKINNSTKEDTERIGAILEGYTNVYFIRETLDRDAVNSLTKCVDVVVSLHRAEGFGLVLAEAMLLGTPTIATNWSSNTEFMNEEVACMVDYRLIEVVIGSLGAPYLDRMFKINNPIYIIYILILAVISMIYYVVYGIQQEKQGICVRKTQWMDC